jgi:hypothetical protein
MTDFGQSVAQSECVTCVSSKAGICLIRRFLES